MVNFDVFSEVPVGTLGGHELSHAISSRWVKTRKPDGTVRCRLVVRGFYQVVDDPDQTLRALQASRLWSFFWHFRLHSGGMFQPQFFCMPWQQVKTFMSFHMLNTIQIRTWYRSWSVHFAWRTPRDFGKTTLRPLWRSLTLAVWRVIRTGTSTTRKTSCLDICGWPHVFRQPSRHWHFCQWHEERTSVEDRRSPWWRSTGSLSCPWQQANSWSN